MLWLGCLVGYRSLGIIISVLYRTNCIVFSCKTTLSLRSLWSCMIARLVLLYPILGMHFDITCAWSHIYLLCYVKWFVCSFVKDFYTCCYSGAASFLTFQSSKPGSVKWALQNFSLLCFTCERLKAIQFNNSLILSSRKGDPSSVKINLVWGSYLLGSNSKSDI